MVNWGPDYSPTPRFVDHKSVVKKKGGRGFGGGGVVTPKNCSSQLCTFPCMHTNLGVKFRGPKCAQNVQNGLARSFDTPPPICKSATRARFRGGPGLDHPGDRANCRPVTLIIRVLSILGVHFDPNLGPYFGHILGSFLTHLYALKHLLGVKFDQKRVIFGSFLLFFIILSYIND